MVENVSSDWKQCITWIVGFGLAFHVKQKETTMKAKEELQDIIELIKSAESPVGMDAVYVHALILDKLVDLEERIKRIEEKVDKVQGEG